VPPRQTLSETVRTLRDLFVRIDATRDRSAELSHHVFLHDPFDHRFEITRLTSGVSYEVSRDYN